MTPPARLVWTNEEGEGERVTTVTFDGKDGKTSLVVHDLYPSKDALDAAIASGATGGRRPTRWDDRRTRATTTPSVPVPQGSITHGRRIA